MKTLFYLSFLTFFIACSSSQKSDEKTEVSDKKEISKAFTGYKNAILNDQGKQALKFVDRGTVDYYSQLSNQVRNFDSAAIEKLSLLDKFTLLTIRARAGVEEIRQFDGPGLFVYAINNGMVGKNSVRRSSIGEAEIDGTKAKAQFLNNGQKTPIYYEFVKEEDGWKLNLLSAFGPGEKALRAAMEESEMEENEFIFAILETLTGEFPPNSIWYPIN